MARDDRDRLIACAEAAAAAAASVVRPCFRAPLDVARKHDDSPVTIADREAEQAMRRVIAAHFPKDGILGEEFGHEREGADRLWVLDPIDGTRAFITGRPLFGTLIGLLEEGRPVLGLIDQPITGERWLGFAGEALRFRGPLGGRPGCRSCPSLAEAELTATSPAMFSPDQAARFARLAGAVRRVSWGGDCYGYGLLALGLIDMIAEADLKLWDWAALVPVIESAGGAACDWQGRPLAIGGDGTILALGDPVCQEAALALLAG
ncbi:MAG: histidinol-phosphatase [Acidibrevibacterium sp.]|uniref:histidinol-phosphatase n=1 Tax=Acidibrevibacterium fodinaquatile TaxID=1969806 RepID=UPI000E0D5087|nr:histidinol-phosphatase [Acidibrevibacterium fodinaquatile]MCA7121041.1 histidinol-phosphatase [Acidibrevibacterium fodinaquatile]